MSILRACETLHASASKPQTVDGSHAAKLNPRVLWQTRNGRNSSQPQKSAVVVGEFTSVMRGRHSPGFNLAYTYPLEDAMGFILVVTLLVLGLAIGAALLPFVAFRSKLTRPFRRAVKAR